MKKTAPFVILVALFLFSSYKADANQSIEQQVYLPFIYQQVGFWQSAQPGIKPTFSTTFVIDDKDGDGRLFAGGFIDQQIPVIFALDLDGDLLGWYEIFGRFNYDPTNNWLIVDTPDGWLKVIDATTGILQWELELPAYEAEYDTIENLTWHASPAPQYDSTSRQIYYFRDHQILAVDSENRTILGSHAYELEDITCGVVADKPASVKHAEYDDAARLLYLIYWTHSCTLWRSHALIVHDVATGEELNRVDVPDYYWLSMNAGNLFGIVADRHLFGTRFHLERGVERYSKEFQPSSEIPWTSKLLYDTQRNRLYHGSGNGRLVVLETQELRPGHIVENAPLGNLVAFSEADDAFYFLQNNRDLVVWPATNLFP